MTCCEDDIEFLGFICYYTEEPPYEHGQWVRVTARFYYGTCSLYEPDGEGPILHLLHMEDGVKPEQELVTFT